MSPASLLLTLAILFGLLGLGSQLVRSRIRNADLARTAFVAIAVLLAGFALAAAVAVPERSLGSTPNVAPVVCKETVAVSPSAELCLPDAAPVGSHPSDHRRRHVHGSAPAQAVSHETSGAAR